MSLELTSIPETLKLLRGPSPSLTLEILPYNGRKDYAPSPPGEQIFFAPTGS